MLPNWRMALPLLLLMPIQGLMLSSRAQSADPVYRIGLIGLDNSHAVAFTKSLNAETSHSGLEGARIVAAFPGGSPDLPVSIDRVQGFSETVAKQGVELVQSIDQLLPKVDAVIITSVDGRVHRAQAEQVIAAGKPVFVDKPASVSVSDAAAIFTLAQEKHVPCFSSSSLRFCPELTALQQSKSVGELQGVVAYSPCAVQLHHPDLFWYGVHGVETLYTLMGPGCEKVTCTRTPQADVVVGVWKDGRIGTFRGGRDGKAGFGALAFGSQGTVAANIKVDYEPLLVEILRAFRTGKTPVASSTTLEILAFMEAANESIRQGGIPIPIQLPKQLPIQ